MTERISMDENRSLIDSSKKHKHSAEYSPEILFAAIAVFFGLIMAVIVPPFQTPDELAHYYRTYDIADLKWIPQKTALGMGDELPQSLYRIAEELTGVIPFHPQQKISAHKIIAYLSIPLNETVKTFIPFPTTALASPVVYIPQALGIAIGKALNLSPLIFLYLGRVFNLITWITLVFFAIRIIPIGKWLFFLLALLPMSVFLAASLSADTITNGLSFLLIACILKEALMDRGSPLHPSNLIAISILLAMISLTKQAYFLTPFLFLLIPVGRLKNATRYLTIFVGLVSVFFFIGSIWFVEVSKIYVPYRDGVSPGNQLHYIFDHPLTYFITIINTLIAHGFYIRSFVGNLGWLDTPLPLGIYLSYPFLLLAASMYDTPNRPSLVIMQRAWLLLIFVFGSLSVFTMLYLSWESVGSESIPGVQGRYFSPLAPLFFLIFQRGFEHNSAYRWRNKLFAVYAIFCLTCSLYVLIMRYYI
jgi:uncharacterized membrane protein